MGLLTANSASEEYNDSKVPLTWDVFINCHQHCCTEIVTDLLAWLEHILAVSSHM